MSTNGFSLFKAFNQDKSLDSIFQPVIRLSTHALALDMDSAYHSVLGNLFLTFRRLQYVYFIVRKG